MNEKENKIGSLIMEEQRIDNLLQLENAEKRSLFYQNMFSLRTFLITLIGFSLTIIGIVLSVLLSSSLSSIIKGNWVLYTGLVLLIINVIISIFYILYIYTIDTNSIYKNIKYNDTFGHKIKELIRKVSQDSTKKYQDYVDGNKEIVESWDKDLKGLPKNRLTIKGKDWTPHFICLLFILGIVFIFIYFLSSLK